MAVLFFSRMRVSSFLPGNRGPAGAREMDSETLGPEVMVLQFYGLEFKYLKKLLSVLSELIRTVYISDNLDSSRNLGMMNLTILKSSTTCKRNPNCVPQSKTF